MATHLDYDTDKRIIYVTTAPSAGTLTLDVQVDIYSDMKEDWKTDTTLNKFKFPLAEPVGGNVIVPGSKNISPYYFLKYDWLMRPYEADHTLYLENGYLLVDGGGDPWLKTLGGFTVNIRDSIPADAYAIGGNASPADIADAVWEEATADHPTVDTFGGEVAQKGDLDALQTEKSYTAGDSGDITVSLGSIGSGDFSDTQTHDENYLEIVETGTGFEVDFTFTAAAEDIPRTFQFQGRYQGNPAHTVRVQAYNHETAAYEYLTAVSGSDQLESSTTDYFKEFSLSRDHINPATNEVIVKIIHSSPGSTAHRLWIDKVNIVAALVSPTLTEEGIATAVWSELLADYEGDSIETFGRMLADVVKLTGYKVTKSGDIITIYLADGNTVWRQYNLANGQRIPI